MRTLKKTKRKKQVKIKNFLVVDIETWGLRATKSSFALAVVFGYYKNKQIYDVFEDREILEKYLLDFKNTYIFAHNGGKYDYLSIFGNIIKKFNKTIIYNESRFICFKSTNNTYFCDSLNLYQTSIEKLGQMLGFPKGLTPEKFKTGVKCHIEQSDIFYCKQDCEILYKALKNLFNEAGTIKMTIASLSLNLFKSSYLEKNIVCNGHENKFFESYSGGRCEAFVLGKGLWHKYDINSLYPYTMLTCRFPEPSSLHEVINPKKQLFFKLLELEGFSEVRLFHKKTYFGYLPLKHNGKLIFPNGTFEGCFNHNELRFAVHSGVVDIIEVKRTITSTFTFNPFENYIKTLYEKRLTSTDEINKTVYKLFMNSLYGRFAQRIKEDSIYYNDESELLEILETLTTEQKAQMTINPISSSREDGYIKLGRETIEDTYTKNTICMLASYITSEARLILLKNLIKYKDAGIAYCDTDSIFCEKEIIENSQDLGSFKKEKEKVVEIFNLKNYIQLDQNNNLHHKIKGIKKNSEKIDINTYSCRKLIGAKEAIRRNLEAGENIEHIKIIKNTFDKRIKNSNFDTEPIFL